MTEFVCKKCHDNFISTHTLTWSVTCKHLTILFAFGKISTHTLTWSVTYKKHIYGGNLSNFNSHAHVERDSILLQCLFPFRYFNSHAHVERDHCQITPPYVILYFNSHAHVERDVSGIWSVVEDVGFQLTRSRGA